MAAAPRQGANGTVTTTSGGEVEQGNPARSSNPILESPIALEDLKHDIEQDMNARGYHEQPGNSDLAIAYYLGARNKLQVTDWGYGYPFWGWGWRWGPAWGMWPQQEVTEYQQGTIVIDVLDGTGRRLLWRGLARMQVPHDPSEYSKVIADGVNAIMKQFPGRPA